MYACPWCERKTFSFWQKQTLGPHRTLACAGCKRRVGVPWMQSHIAALPVFLFAVAGMHLAGDASGSKILALAGALSGAILGMLVTMPLYHRFVPLVRPRR
jgi:uncharacterized protein YqgC (DUF456 family)